MMMFLLVCGLFGIAVGFGAIALVLFCAWTGGLILQLESYIIDRKLKNEDPDLFSITTDWRNHDFA